MEVWLSNGQRPCHKTATKVRNSARRCGQKGGRSQVNTVKKHWTSVGYAQNNNTFFGVSILIAHNGPRKCKRLFILNLVSKFAPKN